jgi:DNA-binding transcriptional regulator YiaG
MTPLEFKQHRARLGLTQAGLAALWNMGSNGGRTVRRWESGERSINPIAIRLMRYEAERTRLLNPSPGSSSTADSKSTTS